MPTTPLAPFKSARRFARSLRLAKRDDWRKWAAANRAMLALKRVPPRPDYAYRNDGWNDWSDWLGSNAFQPKPFVSYAEWRVWLVQQPFRTKLDYNDWCVKHSDERRRLRIPSSPALVYAQFRGWPQELSHNPPPKHRTKKRQAFVPFGVARENVRTLLKSATWRAEGYKKTVGGWRAFARDYKHLLRELNIPATPDTVAQYQEDWRGWDDFLGNNTRPTPNRKR